jgi:hypothetical protein
MKTLANRDTIKRLDQTGASRRRQHISARDQPPLAVLGRSVDAKPDPLQDPGPGGHFAAWEQPALHAKEIRDCFANVADLGKLTCRIRISRALIGAITMKRKEESHD